VHAEDADTIEHAPQHAGAHYRDFLASRPDAAEQTAIATVIERARRTGASAHILHLSSADALPEVAQARADGVALTAETCPHYLTVAAEEIPDGATAFKCCPPIRGAANRDALWGALRDGDIDMVVSDHSPCTADLKRQDTGDFAEAWGGIASLQLGLPVVWTAARERGVPLTDVVRWMSTAPARRVGLAGKGEIAVGADADLCVFAPDEPWTVDVARLHHKNPVSPYAGRTLTGTVRRTWLRGAPIDLAAAPTGRLLTRGER
jgi:allantoinase